MNPRSKKPRTQTLKAQTPLVYLRNSRSVTSTAVTSQSCTESSFAKGLGGHTAASALCPRFCSESAMIDRELRAKIVRLYTQESWKPNAIAKQLQVHHSTVQNALRHAGVERAIAPQPSLADPYLPFLKETMERYPGLPASRLWSMVKQRGYPGTSDGHFRRIVARLRPRTPAEAYLRLQTLPGEQAQVDWASFGKHTVGQIQRSLSAFVMVLSYSRMLYVRFFWGQTQPLFLQGHQQAFECFGGVPRVLPVRQPQECGAGTSRRRSPFPSAAVGLCDVRRL